MRQAKAERFVERLLERVPMVPFDVESARVHARLGVVPTFRSAAIGWPEGQHYVL